MYLFPNSPSFCSQASIISPIKPPKTQSEIFAEKMKEQANDAIRKSASERRLDDYIAIGIDTVNNIVDNPPVKYANGVSKLNYLA